MKVSFVIPTFNCVTYLPHAVKSALDQTHKDLEVIIVDDCSTDQTGQYLSWITKQDPRVYTIGHQTNKGRSEARNTGNFHAQGEYIFVLDADDIASPNRVALSLKKLEVVGMVYGSATVMNEIGMKIGEERADVFNLEKALQPPYYNRIVHSTVAYKRSLADTYQYHGGEISDLGIDDWDQQIRMAKAGVKFDYVPQLISAYRQYEGGISKNRDEGKVLEFKKKALELALV